MGPTLPTAWRSLTELEAWAKEHEGHNFLVKLRLPAGPDHECLTWDVAWLTAPGVIDGPFHYTEGFEGYEIIAWMPGPDLD
jgi:hypothetical protein